MTLKLEGMDAIEKEILDARCAVLIRDASGAVDHLAKAIELLREQWDEKYGKHLPPKDIAASYLHAPAYIAAQEVRNSMMNALQPTHEEKVCVHFRGVREAAERRVRYERIVYGVPGEDDPPHGEGDRLSLASAAEKLSTMMDNLGKLEPKSIPVAQFGERVTKLARALDRRRDVVSKYRHGLTHILYVVDAERDVDDALDAILSVIAYDWGEHKPAEEKLSFLTLVKSWVTGPKAPWYRRYTNYPGPL